MRTSLRALCLFAACAAEPADGENDSVLVDGKGDGAYTDAELAAAVRVANELTRAELDDDVPLNASAAKHIIAHRDGADGVLGSADDDLFDDARELDEVPFVGPVAFARMIEYAHEQGWVDEVSALERVAPGASYGSSFGAAVALGDDQLIVGAPGFADSNTWADRQGAIVVFDRTLDGWGQGTALRPPEAWQLSYAGLGGAIDLDGDRMAVAGRYKSSSSSSTPDVTRVANNPVVTLERVSGTWAYTHHLSADHVGESYGHAVALSGDLLAVGASSYDNGTACPGAVYVYRRTSTGWQRKHLLKNPAPGASCTSDSEFGRDVELVGTTLVVGSPYQRDNAGVGLGAVYVYDVAPTTPPAPQRLQPQGLGPIVYGPYGYFGRELAFDGTTLAVGAGGHEKIFVYRKSAGTWTLDSTVTSRARQLFDAPFHSLALDGERLVIGAFNVSRRSGGAIVVRRSASGWEETRVETPPSGTAHFGEAVAISGARLVVAAPSFARLTSSSVPPPYPQVYSN